MQTYDARNTVIYGLGMTAMFLGIGLFGVFLYISPHLLLGLQYDVPQFVSNAFHYFQHHHDVTGYRAIAGILAPFFISSLALMIIARRIDYFLEVKTGLVSKEDLAALKETSIMLAEVTPIEEETPVEQASYLPAVFILLLILLVIALVFLAEYILYIPPSAV